MSDIQGIASQTQAPVTGNGNAGSIESLAQENTELQRSVVIAPAAEDNQEEERSSATGPGVGQNVDIRV